MSVPKTMFQLSGRGYAAATLSHATVVIIDAQKEYLSGPLALSGMDAAVANIKQLVAAARAAGRPIVHVRHLGTVGGLFDPQGERGEFIPGLEPQGDETIIGKLLPSAFHGTELLDRLQNLGSLDLIVCGFMSHSSVSTTVRAAKNWASVARWSKTPAPPVTCHSRAACSVPPWCRKRKWRSWPTTSPPSP